MQRIWRAIGGQVLAAALVGILSSSAVAQTRLGPEFRVNSYTEGDQSGAAVASDGSGNFVVVWESPEDGNSGGIFGQRFDSAGNPVGSEFQVNTYTTGEQTFPAVAQAPGGEFVVTWDSIGQDGSGRGVFAQHFDSNGTRLGTEFQLNSYTTSQQSLPAVGVDGAGNFTVVWSGFSDGSGVGVFGQQFDSDGTSLGGNFQVNTYTTDNQQQPKIAVRDDGDFVAVWNQSGCTGNCEKVFGQRFASTGAKIGTEMPLSPSFYTIGERPSLGANPSTGDFVVTYGPPISGVLAQRYAASGTPVGSEFEIDSPLFSPSENQGATIAMNTNGEFVAAWTNTNPGTPCDQPDPAKDGWGCGVFARSYSANGQPLSSEFQVNSFTVNGQENPAVAWTKPDEFVMVWTTRGQDGCGPASGGGVFAQRYDSSGNPLGSEFQANSFTPGFQNLGAIAADPSGGFVITWSSPQDGSEYGVFARRFDSTGLPLGSEVLVNTYTLGSQNGPLVASDPAGNFVVSWTSGGVYGSTQDGSAGGVFAQRFTSDGDPLGTEFLVNSYTTYDQEPTGVATDSAGNFIVVWTDYGIVGQQHGHDGGRSGVFAQRYDSGGAPVGTEFQVNTYTMFEQDGARIAMRPSGEFVVVWQQGDYSFSGIVGQRFTSTGTRIGTEQQVNTYTIGYQLNPAIGMDAAGNFAVAWDSGSNYAGGYQDGDNSGIVARRFDSSGAPLTSEILVNTFTVGRQRNPAVAVDAAGDFTVVWESENQDGAGTCPGCPGFGIFGQRFASSGAPLGSEFLVNTYTYTDQTNPRATYDAAGNLVIAWDSRDQDGCGPNGNTSSIAGQRFRLVPSPTRTVTPTTTPTLTPTLTPIPAACAATPISGCATPGKAIIKLKDAGSPGSRKLLWKWTNGTVMAGEFGAPTGATSYRLCVYDDGNLIMSPLIGPGSGWQATATGFKYLKSSTNAAGILKILLKQGAGSAKIIMKGKGANLSLPFPTGITQSTAVTTQMVKNVGSGSQCWQAVFTPPNGGSDSTQFKDKLP